MHLKSLEITGFKSFAKKASLSFNTPITGVVGPNGSGKSNVAEAFRFVLGEQSIKSLRGKRGEDLIFNGGAGTAGSTGSRPNLACVKAVFDNTQRMLNIDFDEVVIERIVHRDSSNEYFINGSLVRLKDIAELLSGAHIGASGHHIISQGEADRILNANILERREMIEDALGLKIYQYKKTESERKLAKTEENMKSVESLRREIAPHLKFLKKQVEKVEKVEEMRQSLKSLYRDYLSREDAYLVYEKTRLSREKSAPASELSKLDADLLQAKNILSESKNADAASREVINLEQALQSARNEKDAVVRELGKIEGEVAAVARAITKEKEKQSRDDSKTIYLRDVETIIKRVFEIESLEEVRKILNEFVALHRNNSGSAESAAALSEFEKDMNDLAIRKTSLEKHLSEASNKETLVHEDYTQLRQKIEREKDTNREAEKNVFKIIARQNELRGLLASIKNAEDRVMLSEQSFRHDLEDARILVGREALDYQKIELNTIVSVTDQNALVGLRKEQEDRHHQIEKIKIRIEDSGAAGGTDVLKEYKEAEERDAFLARELADLEKSKESLVLLINDLVNRLDVEFKNGISKINAQFNNFFALMFGGGSASLDIIREKKRKRRADTDLDISDENITAEIENSENSVGENEGEGKEGIDIQVNLPRKKVKGLMMLSGGERALTSIALLFAISQVNPPPFIILDETDAALDEANSKKYGDMITSLSQYSQLILITHNRETMSRAGVLYGVTMGSDGASKLLSIAFDEAVTVAK